MTKNIWLGNHNEQQSSSDGKIALVNQFENHPFFRALSQCKD